MKIQQIKLVNFRNYGELQLDLTDNLNIFIGDNAQGKTNIVEAIHYAALGISHRTRQDKELIGWQAAEGSIRIAFCRREVHHQLELLLSRNKSKEILFNGEKIRQKDLPGNLTMILFSPEDLMLIKGAPQLRRRFLDIQLSQCSSRYYAELVKYNKLLLQRNNLLKDLKLRQQREVMLELWDLQLAEVGAYLLGFRLKAVNQMAAMLKDIHSNISQQREELLLSYEVSGRDEAFPREFHKEELQQWLLQKLTEGRTRDIYRGSTSVGIHRDDLDFTLNGVKLKAYGSQGQQRSSVLSLKLAELEFLHGENGEYPVLLLDDVMSELDGKRRQELLALLRDKGIQTLITATDESLFTQLEQDDYYYVNGGKVAR